MKTQKQAKGSVNTLDQLKSQLNHSQKLNLAQMKSICGGDGEDNGSVGIIIIPTPPLSPVPPSSTPSSK